MTHNVNRVPKKQWMKWSPKAREVFNRVYRFAIANQDLMTHPKQERAAPFHWKTVAWNAAWIAAGAVDNTIPTAIVEDSGDVRKVA